MPVLVCADDYGYAAGYSRGILEAAEAGALDAVSAMVLRPWCEAEPLLRTGVEVGLHLEPPGPGAAGPEGQAEAFERLFGRPPTRIDGHHHCHADPSLEAQVTQVASRIGARVRPVDDEHLARLRAAGIAPTADRIWGRMSEAEALVIPPDPPDTTIEWIVHPGHPDPASGSAYDAGRAEDLRAVLEWGGG